jgi:sugar lactone lactonase YvrE
MKKILIIFFMMAALFLIPSHDLEANGLPYRTFTYSQSTRRFVFTQDAYLPLSISYNLAGYQLQNPLDITIDKNDNVYITDFGTEPDPNQPGTSRAYGRVIKYSLSDDEVVTIGEDTLKQPSGVHVGLDGHLYVADNGNKKGYQFLFDNTLNTYSLGTVYEKPVGTPFFSESDPFDPTKIVTDKGHNVYLLLAGNINGLVEYENNGNFFGFFGGNTIPNTWDNILRFILFDEQQRREWFQMIPKPVYNTAISNEGLILTTTRGDMGYLKLNIANLVFSQSIWGHTNVEDVFVGPYNTIFTVSSDGYIVEYGPDGSVLFVFSGPDQFEQKGLFNQPTGIAVDSRNNLFVIDRGTKALQVFIPTDFADLVHYAIQLYQDGRYVESLEPWQEVLKMNSLFDLANKGIADAYFAQMDYENAREYYQIARDPDGYSNAFWEVRNTFLLTSGSFIVTLTLIFIVLFIFDRFIHLSLLIKKPVMILKRYLNQFDLYKELMFPFYIFKKPDDGYYGIKREGKGSNLSATIYILLFFLAYVFYTFNTSFLFNPVIPSEINVFQQMITIFLPFFLFVLANYLVCSIRDGEGKLSDVYQASAYTLLPLIITLPLASIVSNGLTYNESFIFTTLMFVGIFVTILYFIIMVKEIHFYDLKPTIFNILITIFTALMILAVVFIVYLLLSEVFTLISDVIREVILRV